MTGLTLTGIHGNRLVGDRWSPMAPTLPPLLMLHGGGQTRHSWDAAAARLSAAGANITTYDARGHGDSDRALDGDYGLDTFAKDLATVLETFATPPVVLGASLGGLSALLAAGELGAPASGLVLVDVAPHASRGGAHRILSFMRRHTGGFASLDEVADAINEYNPRPHKRRLEGLRKNVRQGQNGRWYWHWDPAFLEYGDEPTQTSLMGRLDRAAENLTIPTLLIRGTDSDVVTPEAAQDFLARVRTATLVEVSSGHMVVGDDNDVFTASVLPFVSSIV
jgi:pimeloyl-ACP methyl ester carboxylesterase